MAGTARQVFPGSVVTPAGFIANSDTKHLWISGRIVTKNIYRWVPAPLELIKNFHTVDER
jgi:Gly-Xaa carboxypeptidase